MKRFKFIVLNAFVLILCLQQEKISTSALFDGAIQNNQQQNYQQNHPQHQQQNVQHSQQHGQQFAQQHAQQPPQQNQQPYNEEVVLQLHQFVLANFHNYVYVQKNRSEGDINYSVVFKPEDIQHMLETPLDFKKYIFYRHLEHTEEAQKVRGHPQDEIEFLLKIVYFAVTDVLVWCVPSTTGLYTEMMNTNFRRRPLDFLIEYHARKQSESYYDFVKRYFFQRAIRRVVPNQDHRDKEFHLNNASIAFGDESIYYEKYMFLLAYNDIESIIGELSIQAYQNRITKREIKPFQIHDIPLLWDTSNEFKRTLVQEYEAIIGNPIISPHVFILPEQMPGLNIVETFRKYEALFALESACAITMKLYKRRLPQTPSTAHAFEQLEKLGKERPLVLISDVHKKVLERDGGPSRNRHFDGQDLANQIKTSYEILTEDFAQPQSPISTQAYNNNAFVASDRSSMPLFADKEEPGLGDDNPDLDLTGYTDICENILHVYKTRIPHSNSTLRQRLADLKFKVPSRFRNILLTHYFLRLSENAGITDLTERSRVSAYESVQPAIDQMFEFVYDKRIVELGSPDKERIQNFFWKEYEPIFYLFFMRICVLRYGADNSTPFQLRNQFMHFVRTSMKYQVHMPVLDEHKFVMPPLLPMMPTLTSNNAPLAPM